VQFHPEFDAEAIRAYLAARRERVSAEGLDVDALLAGIRDTPAAARLLRRFAELIDA
jgi:GMP synthase (glutamine-hydrolysing)